MNEHEPMIRMCEWLNGMGVTIVGTAQGPELPIIYIETPKPNPPAWEMEFCMN